MRVSAGQDIGNQTPRQHQLWTPVAVHCVNNVRHRTTDTLRTRPLPLAHLTRPRSSNPALVPPPPPSQSLLPSPPTDVSTSACSPLADPRMESRSCAPTPRPRPRDREPPAAAPPLLTALLLPYGRWVGGRLAMAMVTCCAKRRSWMVICRRVGERRGAWVQRLRYGDTQLEGNN